MNAGAISRVWILANCPVPGGGPAHSGTATSKAFINGVRLDPVPSGGTTPTPTGNGVGTSPWVRGEAQVSGTVPRGNYQVDVKCDGTNDIGRAVLRVTRAEPEPTSRPTKVPTKAPRAGGGGTYGMAEDEGSSIPFGPAGVLIGLAVAGGIGLIIVRRSRS
ncbi:hypothetical protein HII36_15410 [Nonomuraea sp. NN258]|uniref:hypothetical protein n=1 Tax=Nonomuraea antri TaxID=2730852 RepID=UPI001569288E|nr:hypothetical protein [Nonomuraea antri]NRQ33222.1 hypothetical protein [Nonomuraea antri]